MTYNKKLWTWLAGIFLVSFAILGLLGREIYVQAPPVPERVVTTDGQELFTKAEIQTGRETVITTLSSKPRQFGDELFNPMFLSRSNAAP